MPRVAITVPKNARLVHPGRWHGEHVSEELNSGKPRKSFSYLDAADDNTGESTNGSSTAGEIGVLEYATH